MGHIRENRLFTDQMERKLSKGDILMSTALFVTPTGTLMRNVGVIKQVDLRRKQIYPN